MARRDAAEPQSTARWPQPGVVTTLSRQGSGTDARQTLLTLVGALLVVLGGGLLVSVAMMVVTALTEPGQLRILATLTSTGSGGDGALSGHVAGTSFAIAIDEPLRTLLFGVLGLWLLGLLVSILKTLLLTGKELLLSSRRPRDEP